MRLRIDLSYDGTGFHGWAKQPGLRTVQGDVETALNTVLRTAPEVSLTLTCAGRTDTGVHARGQVVHVDCEIDPDEVARLPRRLNGVLDPDVRIRVARVAPDGFDARFSARWRRYVYRICDDPLGLDPLRRSYVQTWPRRLDEDAMNRAALSLLGEHDFAAFCKKREGASTIRTLLELRVRRSESELAVTVRADAFCHSMVRALMGCLVSVGEGRHQPGWASEVLTGRVRHPSVQVMPARGLTLEQVDYPADADLHSQSLLTRRVRSL